MERSPETQLQHNSKFCKIDNNHYSSFLSHHATSTSIVSECVCTCSIPTHRYIHDCGWECIHIFYSLYEGKHARPLLSYRGLHFPSLSRFHQWALWLFILLYYLVLSYFSTGATVHHTLIIPAVLTFTKGHSSLIPLSRVYNVDFL